MEYLHHTSFGIGVLGVLVIVIGVASGLLRFLRSELVAMRGMNVDEERKRLRHLLGYYLLLGLEFLIAADIIDTLMKPSVQDLTVLGAIVLIRTVISYSLNAELKSGQQVIQVGRVTSGEAQPGQSGNGAHGVTHPNATLTHQMEGATERPL